MGIAKSRLALFAAASVGALLAAQGAYAQAPETSDEILVLGVRGAQEAGIGIKRSSAEIVDAIVAEDIGKLPDVTIADALQRVTGVQISRAAGEGSLVSIRGAQQVMTTLNGERFITAEDVLSNTANFSDIPASLITGVNVYKSQSAGMTDGGLGGVLDLQSIRALNLDQGATFNLAAQGGWGSLVDGTDTRFDGLVGYNWGDRFAMSLAGSYSDTTSASSFQSLEFDRYGEGWSSPGAPVDINGNGNTSDDLLVPIGWNSYVNSRQFDRKRTGVAYNFNAHLSDAFEIVGDIFYNKMEEDQHGQQLFVNGNFANRASLGAYTLATGQPAVLSQGSTGNQINPGDPRTGYVTAFRGLSNGLRGGVQSTFRDTEAWNTNIELLYDNGGPFTGSLRWVHADASRESLAFTVAQQTDTRTISQSLGGPAVSINPGAIPATLSYPIEVGLGEDELTYIIGDELATLAAQPSAWYLHSSWLEKNAEDLEMDVLRADGSLAFGDSILSMDFGLRISNREASEQRADYFSPSGFTDVPYTKYQEAGYAIFQGGPPTGNAARPYDPLPVYGLDSPTLGPYVTTVRDFGEVNGLNVALPFINTRAISDPAAWRDLLYGQGTYFDAPDRTYKVEEEQIAGYLQLNIKDAPITDAIRMSGNVGVRVVRTTVTVTQNLLTDENGVPALRSDIIHGADPNHAAYIDQGDVVTETERTRALPSINLNFDFGDDWRIKAAYYETQALQPFPNLGQGSITYFNGEASCSVVGPECVDIGGGVLREPFQRVSNINNSGNPKLDPWFERTFSAALEWYPRENTILSFGVFHADVESYTFNDVTADPTVADSDGVVRNGASVNTITNGEGASYYGFEFAYQQSFDFLPGLLGNTGTTLNWTYSPSQGGVNPADGSKIILADGSEAPFNGSAENQVNAVLWYQDERFQARVAANYLTDLYQGTFNHWSFSTPPGTNGLGNYQDGTLYIDAGASYDVTPEFQVFLQGSNLTEEAPANWQGWSDFHTTWNQFERVITAGVRARF
jgi:iron complex outermembrane recepter protein